MRQRPCYPPITLFLFCSNSLGATFSPISRPAGEAHALQFLSLFRVSGGRGAGLPAAGKNALDRRGACSCCWPPTPSMPGGGPISCCCCCGSTLVNYALGREIEQRRARQNGPPRAPDRRPGVQSGPDRHFQIRHAVRGHRRPAVWAWACPSRISSCRWRSASSPSSRSAIWWMPMRARRTAIPCWITLCSWPISRI